MRLDGTWRTFQLRFDRTFKGRFDQTFNGRFFRTFEVLTDDVIQTLPSVVAGQRISEKKIWNCLKLKVRLSNRQISKDKKYRLWPQNSNLIVNVKTNSNLLFQSWSLIKTNSFKVQFTRQSWNSDQSLILGRWLATTSKVIRDLLFPTSVSRRRDFRPIRSGRFSNLELNFFFSSEFLPNCLKSKNFDGRFGSTPMKNPL